MNRKVLLGIFIVFGVGFFLYLQSKKSKTISQENLASSAYEESQPIQKKNTVEAEQSSVMSERIPNAVAVPQTGKYSIRISKPMHSVQDEIKKRDDYLKKNSAGLVFKLADQNFVLMKLRASKEKDHSVDKSLGHELFPVDLPYAQKVIVEESSYPVIYRESNGRLGLLTGVILIQTQDKIAADQLALRYPIDLKMFDSSIALASYKVRDGEGLYEIFNNIKQNERVKSITVEVLDSYKGF